MMGPLSIAVLSDMHVGTGARAADLCPHVDTEVRDPEYRQKFLAFIRRKGIKADYLILPGDVSHKAQAREFKLAGEVVSEVAAAMGVEAEQIVYVPGNHDVDWSRCRAEDTPTIRHQQKYLNLRSDTFFNAIMSRSATHLLDSPHFSVWETGDVIVVGYNSAWHDEPGAPTHHGLMAEEHLTELDAKLKLLDMSPDRLRIFLVHHHPVAYSDPIPDLPDFSAMTNAGNLLRVLYNQNFDLLLHGHKHSPHFETYSINGGFPIATLCAGSFSAYIDPRWNGYVTNQFHLIQVHQRDVDTGVVRGVVESWTYLCGHHWVPSKQNNGIAHKMPFGTYTVQSELRSIVRPVIIRLLAEHDFAEWSSIVMALPHLEHLPPARVVEVVDSLSNELAYRRHGVDPHDMLILKIL